MSNDYKHGVINALDEVIVHFGTYTMMTLKLW